MSLFKYLVVVAILCLAIFLIVAMLVPFEMLVLFGGVVFTIAFASFGSMIYHDNAK